MQPKQMIKNNQPEATMNLVSNVLRATFRCVAEGPQRVAPLAAPFFTTLLEVLRRRCVTQSVVEKFQPTQWFGGGRNTATLLSLKNYIFVYVHTYACVHRGSIGAAFEMLRPRDVCSVRSFFPAAAWANFGVVS